MALQKKCKKILIIGPAWLGDMIMAQSLFKEMHKIYNELVIDVLAPKWCSGIIARMPEVRKAIIMPIGHGQLRIGERYQLGRSLRSEKYDESIVLPNSLKSALIPFFAKIKKRTGWLGEMRYGLLNNHTKLPKEKYPKMVERFAALAHPLKNCSTLESISYPYLKVSESNINKLKKKYSLDFTKPIIAICPGAAFGTAKCWPQEYYGEVAKELIKDLQVWLLGSPADVRVAEYINSSSGNKCLNFVGQTTLEDAVDLLSLTKIVLCNDSGLMHLASALDKNIIAFYGPTPEDFAPPLTKNAISLYTDIDCRPCRQRECPLKHHKCMRDIHPKTVVEHVRKILCQ